MLDTLQQRESRATFFLIGDRVAQAPELARRIVADGHEIGNHTHSHPLEVAKLGVADLSRQFSDADQEIRKAIGFRPRLVRPPFGAVTFSLLRYLSGAKRWPAVLWSCDPGGDQGTFDSNADKMIRTVRRHAFQPGDIILLHDPNVSTYDGLPAVLDRLDELKLTTVTVSELLGIDKVQ